MAPPAVANAINSADLGGAIDRGNASLNGNLDLSDDNVSLAIDKDLSRARALKKRLIDQLIKKGKVSASLRADTDEKKQLKAYLKKTYGNENYGLDGSVANNQAIENMDRFKKIMDKGDAPKGLAEDKKLLSSGLARPPKVNPLKGLDLDDLDDLDDFKNGAALDQTISSLGSDEEYVFDKNQIVKKPEVSIFQVISNRYNVLRINKRIGVKVTK